MIRLWVWFFCLIALACLGIKLGLWQWQKAIIKEQWLQIDNTPQAFTEWWQLTNNKPFDWDNTEQWLGKTIILQGQFTNTFVGLLDNQTVNQQPGLDVIGIFELDTHQKILVNRGWIPWSQRDTLPEISHPTQTLTLTGKLYPFSQPGLTLGEYPQHLQKNPILLPWVDANAIGSAFNQPLFGAEFRVEPNQPLMFHSHWQLSVISPAKHRAYAWQWAGLSLLAWGYALWIFRQLLQRRDQRLQTTKSDNVSY